MGRISVFISSAFCLFCLVCFLFSALDLRCGCVYLADTLRFSADEMMDDAVAMLRFVYSIYP